MEIIPWITLFRSFKFTPQVCIKHLHTPYIQLPVEKEFYTAKQKVSQTDPFILQGLKHVDIITPEVNTKLLPL